MLYEEWLSMPSDVKNAQYNGSFENYAYFWKKANSGAQAPAQTQQGGNPSIFDEADAIVGN
jgi:hypothetical protein